MMHDKQETERTKQREKSSAVNALSNGWEYIPCPLCHGSDHEEVFSAKNELFGAAVVCSLRRCSCGLLLTNPQPQGVALAAFYSSASYYTHQPSRGVRSRAMRWIRKQQLRPSLLRISLWIENRLGFSPFLIRFAPQVFTLSKGLSFLDFGCGSGKMLLLARELGLLAVGLEPDDKAREVATLLGVQVVCSLQELDSVSVKTTQKTEFSASRIDRILVRHVLEHLPDPVGTIRELGRRLAPNGRLLISVPNAESWQAEVFGEFWIGYDMPRHLWHFTAATLCRLVEAAGLNVVQSYTVELPSFAVLSNTERARRAGIEIDYHRHPNGSAGQSQRGTEIVLVAVRASSIQRDAD